MIAGETEGGPEICGGRRNHHTEGHHLVDRCVRRVTSPIKNRGQQLTFQVGGQGVEGELSGHGGYARLHGAAFGRAGIGYNPGKIIVHPPAHHRMRR